MFKVYLKVMLTLFLLSSSIVVVVSINDFDSDLLNSIEKKEREDLRFKSQDLKTLFNKLNGDEQYADRQLLKSEQLNSKQSMENLKYYNNPYEIFTQFKEKDPNDINSLFDELHKDVTGNSYEYQLEKLALAKQEATRSDGYLRHLKTKFFKRPNFPKPQLNNPSETRHQSTHAQPVESTNHKVNNEHGPSLNVSNAIKEGSYENRSNDVGYKIPGITERADSQDGNPSGPVELYTSNKNDFPDIKNNTPTPNPNALFALLDEDLNKGDWYQQGLKDIDILYLKEHYPSLFDKVNNAINAKKGKLDDVNMDQENYSKLSNSFDKSQVINKFSDLYKEKNRLLVKNNQESDISMHSSKSQQDPTKPISQSSGDNNMDWSNKHQVFNKLSDLYKAKSSPPIKSNQETDSSMHQSKSEQVPIPSIAKNLLESETPKDLGKYLLPLETKQDPAKTLQQGTLVSNSNGSLPSDKQQKTNILSYSNADKSHLPFESNQDSTISMNQKTTQQFDKGGNNNMNWSPPSDKHIYFNEIKINPIGVHNRRKISVNRLEQHQNMKPLLMHRLQNSKCLELPNGLVAKPSIKLKVTINDSQLKGNNRPKPNAQNLLQKLENLNVYEVLQPQSKPEAVLQINTANNVLHIKSLNPSEHISSGPRRNLVSNSKPSANNKNILVDNASNVPIPRLLDLYNDICTAQLRDPNYMQPVPANKLSLTRKSNDFDPLEENNVPNRESLRHMLKVLRKYKSHVSTLLRDASDLEMGVMEAIIDQLEDSSELIGGQTNSRKLKDNSKVSLSGGNGRRNFYKNNDHLVGKITTGGNRKTYVGSSYDSANRKSDDKEESVKCKSYLDEKKMKNSVHENVGSYKSVKAPKEKNVALVKCAGNSNVTKSIDVKLKGEGDEDEDGDGLKKKRIPIDNNNGKVKKFIGHKKIKHVVNEGEKVAKHSDEGKTSSRQMQFRNDKSNNINKKEKKLKKYMRNNENYKNEKMNKRFKSAKFGAHDPRLGKNFLRTKETFTEKPELPDKSDLDYYEDLKGDDVENRGIDNDDFYVDD